jgi:hypothetical protein
MEQPVLFACLLLSVHGARRHVWVVSAGDLLGVYASADMDANG